MKPRKSKDLQDVLLKKGFKLHPEKDHHQYYILYVDGKKQTIRTYLSHGGKEYGRNLMGEVKKQLKFRDIQKAEDFFDCPMSAEQYVKMLKDDGTIR